MAISTVPVLLLLLVFLHGLVPRAFTDATVCNNSPALCSRAYNNITYLGAHDSPFVRNESNGYSLSGDQFYPSTTQLNAGIRLLTAQVHAFTTDEGTTEWHLCHTSCLLYDAGTLTAWLQDIQAWLEANLSDVVTILLVNADSADAATLDAQFGAASGIKQYIYTPSSTTQPLETWPSLEQMINASKRLVTFVASLDPTNNTVAPYLLDEFTFVFETPYNNTAASSFSCLPDRPPSLTGNTSLALSLHLLPLVNHFLYDVLGYGVEIPAVEQVDTTNSPSTTLAGSLGLEADQCTTAYGDKAPTFFLVDFFNVGPALETVDRLNGVLGDTQGREVVPTDILGLDNASAVVTVVSDSSTSISTILQSSTGSAVGITTNSVTTTTVVSSGSNAASYSTSSDGQSTQLATPSTTSARMTTTSATATASQTGTSAANRFCKTGLATRISVLITLVLGVVTFALINSM